MSNIVHLTSAHPRYDTRIFLKECLSLAKSYDVVLVVADGKGNEDKNGIRIIDVGAPSGRFQRLYRTTRRILSIAETLDAEIYHLHDPELIWVGKVLKKQGKRVVFDAHEDLPKQILAKHYLPTFSRRGISYIAKQIECSVLKKFDAVVAATPFIASKFCSCGVKRTVTVANYPLVDSWLSVEPDYTAKQVCYIGALYPTRGIEELVQAVAKLDDVRLVVAGRFGSKAFQEKMVGMSAWKKVDFRGFVGHDEIKRILSTSAVGVVTLHPTPSYTEAYPVKMFEYMAAGVAVLASDFPLYRDIVEKNGCGRCVDPLNADAIAAAIETMLSDSLTLKQMGVNGKQAVRKRYNWQNEEMRLLALYEDLLR